MPASILASSPSLRRALTPLALGLLLVAPGTPAVPGRLAAQFASGVELVEVYATVTSRDGTIVGDLTEADFTIFEEGRQQNIAAFARGSLPFSVALVIDRSFSMAGERLRVAKSAAHMFVGELADGDQAMVVAIGGNVETIVPLTADRLQLHRAIDGLDTWGVTPLFDAVVTSLSGIERAPGRRALVLVTDGRERFSKTTSDAALERARRTDVLIYPVTLDSDRVEWLETLAGVTGGRAFFVSRPDRLGATFKQIAHELRGQYLLGYAPPSVTESGYRRIEVRVGRKGLRVVARQGYYAVPAARPN